MTTTGNSSPLAACIVIIQTSRFARAGLLVGLREQRQPIDEAAERRLRLARLVVARRRHELHQVLDPLVRFLAVLVAQVLQVAGLVEHLADRDRDRVLPRDVGEAGDQVAEHAQRRDRARRPACRRRPRRRAWPRAIAPS